MIRRIDEKDYKIIELLKENCKYSIKDISKKTSMPITTVYSRIKNLEKEGIIKNYTVVLDDKKLGTISAFIMVYVDFIQLKNNNKDENYLIKRIQSHDAVEFVSSITGDADLVVKIRVNNTHDLNKFLEGFLRRIEGVAKTCTMVILSEY